MNLQGKQSIIYANKCTQYYHKLYISFNNYYTFRNGEEPILKESQIRRWTSTDTLA